MAAETPARVVGVLAGVELFQVLTDDERARIADLGRVEYWRRGATLLEEGAQGPRMMVLLEGRVEILRRDAHGRQRPIAAVGPGEVLGETSLLLDLPRTATVRALDDLKVFTMDRAAFRERVDAGDPAASKVGLALSRTLARRLMALNDRVMALLAENDELRERFGEERQAVFSLWDGD